MKKTLVFEWNTESEYRLTANQEVMLTEHAMEQSTEMASQGVIEGELISGFIVEGGEQVDYKGSWKLTSEE